MNQFYLYRHIRTDLNIPFYIGVGKKELNHGSTLKQEYKRAFRPFDRTKHWKNIAAKGYDVEIIYETDSLEEIKLKEIEFINLYGKSSNGGILVNINDGGGSGKGRKLTDQEKIKISQSLKGRPTSNETREKLRLASLNHILPEESRIKISIAKKGFKHTDESKKKIVQALIKRPVSEETRNKIRLAHTGRKGQKFSDERKKKHSELLKAYWAKRKGHE